MRIFTVMSAIALVAPLCHAGSNAADTAERRDSAALRKLISTRTGINDPQPDGTTALHWAAHWNDLESLQLLLKAGADAKAANRYGATPLSEAAAAGNAQMVDSLIKAGASATTLATKDGETVLMTAARGGYLDVVKILVEHGADVNAHEAYRNQTALMWAASERHSDVVKFLLQHGADAKVSSLGRANAMPKLSAASSVTPMAAGGLAAIHFAAREGDTESLGAMLDAGVDINQLDTDKTVALSVALLNKHYTAAKFLLDRGADPNVPDSRGRTPLYTAIDMRNEDYSATPSRKEDDALPSLDIVKALLDKGADPNLALTRSLAGRSGMDSGDTTLDKGATPIMRAARAGDVEVMRLLLAKGADPKRATGLGNNMLLFAAGVGYRDKNTHGTEAGTLEAVKLSLAQGLDMKSKNTRGETAIHGAAGRGADTIVKYLVEQGAEIDAKNSTGLTTLDYAMGKNVFGQLPVPHESTVILVKKLGGHEGKPVPPPAPAAAAVAK